jgi:hypothetical protein
MARGDELLDFGDPEGEVYMPLVGEAMRNAALPMRRARDGHVIPTPVT